MKSILLMGDAHLRDQDPELDAFLLFLRQVPILSGALYILGDLFDLWIGSPTFQSDCHRRVVDGLIALKAAGIEVVYVEGNRDYRLKSLYGAGPFSAVVEEGWDVAFGGRRIHLAHGDLVNREDRPYRLWRRLAKGPWLLGVLEWLPRQAAAAVALHLERKIARTNRRHRVQFPQEQCRRFALERRGRGSDTLVLGHFHREMRLAFEQGADTIEVFVLPSWRENRRYLRILEDGSAAFESFGSPGVGS